MSGDAPEQMRTFAEFLEKVPPGVEETVNGVVGSEKQPGTGHFKAVLNGPRLQLECCAKKCNGIRTFARIAGATTSLAPGPPVFTFMHYKCCNCEITRKSFGLMIRDVAQGHSHATVTKIGEFPAFGPGVPSRVITLIGPDRELFLKGRRAENQGLGIGAFAYYRRAVEGNKNRLIDEVIKVAKTADPSIIPALRDAKKETQFSKALEGIKDAIPEAIRIQGHNPFTLLHSALSEGIHDKSDEECLMLATSIREVLFAMCERIALILKEQRTLDDAVKTISSRQKKT